MSWFAVSFLDRYEHFESDWWIHEMTVFWSLHTKNSRGRKNALLSFLIFKDSSQEIVRAFWFDLFLEPTHSIFMIEAYWDRYNYLFLKYLISGWVRKDGNYWQKRDQCFKSTAISGSLHETLKQAQISMFSSMKCNLILLKLQYCHKRQQYPTALDGYTTSMEVIWNQSCKKCGGRERSWAIHSSIMGCQSRDFSDTAKCITLPVHIC